MKNRKVLTYEALHATLNYDLGLRKITFNHHDLDFKNSYTPLSISHVYQINSINNGYGKGFKLNLEQELVKESESVYKLILPDGAEELFEELYYIKRDNIREYVSKSEITVLPDGSLEYNSKKVFKELKNNKGIRLSGDYSDFIQSDKIDFKNEQLSELENSILQIKQTIANLKYNIYEYSKYDNEKYSALLETQNEYERENLSFTAYKNSNDYTSSMNTVYSEKEAYYEITKKTNKTVGGLVLNSDGTFTYDEGLSRMTYENMLGYRADKHGTAAKYSNLDSMPMEEQVCEYYSQNFQDALDLINQNISDKNQAIEAVIWGYQKRITTAECEYLADKKAYEDEAVDQQRGYYAELLPLTIELKSYYEKLLFMKEYEKEQLLKIIPKLYLANTEGLVYGFNEAGKLCVVFDSFEHQILIEYNNANQIKDIVDEKNNVIRFIYNDSDELIRIYESEGNYVSYAYDESGYLSKIIYSDNTVSTLEYNFGYLYKFIDVNHQGIYVQYMNGVVTQIRNLFLKSDSTEAYQRIEYFNYSEYFTAVSNNKNNTITHYLFDENQYLVTEYRTRNKILYSLSVLEEEDKCCSYVISSNVNHNKRNIAETILLNEDTPTAAIPVLGGLNGYSTDYVLYAFAEADSISAIRRVRKTAYCTHSNEDKEDYTAYFEMRCNLIYGNETITYSTPFNPYIKTKQLAAIPIALKEDLEGKAILPDEITVFFDYRDNQGECRISSVVLALGDYVYSAYNEAYNKTSDYYSEVITAKTVMGEKQGEYIKQKKIEYIYNSDEFIEKEIETIRYEEYDLSGTLVSKDCKIYTKSYKYNSMNKLSLEEDSKGNTVEYLYNAQGLCVMKKVYTISLPNQAYIEETQYDEDGQIIRDTNALGYKKEYKYINSLNSVITTPNGNILNIGSKNQTYCVSSEADGIENYTAVTYDLDRPVEYNTEGMRYRYIYDDYGREKEFYINDKLFCSFEYLEMSTTLSCKTIYVNAKGYEKITDKYGNILKINQILGDTVIPYIEYELDSKDRIIKEIQYDGGTPYITNYTYENDTLVSVATNDYTKTTDYDIYGNEKETAYQIGDNVIRYQSEYHEDNLKQYTSKYNDEVLYEQQYKTDKLGRVVDHTNTLLNEHYTYLTKNGRTTNLISLHQKNINGQIQRNKYTYDKEGNILSKTENYAYTRYTYDALNRLIREDNKAFDKTYLYTYDGNGNILSKGIYDYSTEDTLENEEIIRYNYNDFNDYLTNYNGQTIEYDSIGNPTVYKDKVLCWNQRELIQYGNCSFTYSNTHIRTSKYTKNKKSEYIYDGSMILKERITNYTSYFYEDSNILEGQTVDEQVEEIEYIYSKTGIIGFRYHDKVYYYNKNILGDILEIYDSKHNLVGKYEYDAWGNHKILTNIDNIANINPFRYRSYYYDNETGMFLVTSRYYDPEIGRFISPDSIEYLDPESINGLNLYVYCGNDPINNYDPTGHFTLPNWAKWVIGGVAFVGAVALTYLTGGALAPVFIGMAGSILLDGVVEGAISSANGGSFWEGFADGAANGAMWGGIFALGGAALRTIKMFKNGVAIGENMKRVNNLAKAGHQITYKGMPGFKFVKMFGGDDLARTLSMRHNQAFIERMMKWGVKIVDFGIDTSRNYRSFYYLMETIVSNGYGLLQLMY